MNNTLLRHFMSVVWLSKSFRVNWWGCYLQYSRGHNEATIRPSYTPFKYEIPILKFDLSFINKGMFPLLHLILYLLSFGSQLHVSFILVKPSGQGRRINFIVTKASPVSRHGPSAYSLTSSWLFVENIVYSSTLQPLVINWVVWNVSSLVDVLVMAVTEVDVVPTCASCQKWNVKFLSTITKCYAVLWKLVCMLYAKT